MEDKLPCKNCITLSICRSQVRENAKNIRKTSALANVFNKCELIGVYINNNGIGTEGLLEKRMKDLGNFLYGEEVFDFTILDIGANLGYYSIRAASEYDAVSIMIENKDG